MQLLNTLIGKITVVLVLLFLSIIIISSSRPQRTIEEKEIIEDESAQELLEIINEEDLVRLIHWDFEILYPNNFTIYNPERLTPESPIMLIEDELGERLVLYITWKKDDYDNSPGAFITNYSEKIFSEDIETMNYIEDYERFDMNGNESVYFVYSTEETSLNPESTFSGVMIKVNNNIYFISTSEYQGSAYKAEFSETLRTIAKTIKFN